MDSQKLLFSLFTFLLLSEQGSGDRGDLRRKFRPKKLYVFGDSYADTGNIDISNFSSLKFPYGITFPGKPSGRFSDGRVLTDYAASYLGVKPPVPFRIFKDLRSNGKTNNGVNFAYGGTGVFNTSVSFPNMNTQIDLFDTFIVKKDIHSSLALVSVSGNDYYFYLARNGSIEGFKAFIISVVDQIVYNLKRIHRLGVKKVVVTGLGPLGCLPPLTSPSSFTQCNSTINSFVTFHNLLLKQAVSKLNNEVTTKNSSSNSNNNNNNFFILDMYGSFMSIINRGSLHQQGNFDHKPLLKPCCLGVTNQFSCGSVDQKGNQKFTLCKDPKSAFFWDSLHPTQQGWLQAFNAFQSILKNL